MSDIDPLAMVIVVDGQKCADGTLIPIEEDVFDAAARAIAEMLSSEDAESRSRLNAWTDDRIRKIVKRARGKRWNQIVQLALPHVIITCGPAAVAVFAPLRPSEYPDPLAKAQVAGLEIPVGGRPSAGRALTIHMNPALGMSTGKQVAQMGHAVQMFLAEYPNQAHRWMAAGARVHMVADVPQPPHAIEIVDAGFTEVPPDSHTAIIMAADIARFEV